MQYAWLICLSELQMARPLAEVFQARPEDIDDMIQSRSAERIRREWRMAQMACSVLSKE